MEGSLTETALFPLVRVVFFYFNLFFFATLQLAIQDFYPDAIDLLSSFIGHNAAIITCQILQVLLFP